jgi:hypothetical protein
MSEGISEEFQKSLRGSDKGFRLFQRPLEEKMR